MRVGLGAMFLIWAALLTALNLALRRWRRGELAPEGFVGQRAVMWAMIAASAAYGVYLVVG